MSKNRVIKIDSVECMRNVKKLIDEGRLKVVEKRGFHTKDIYLQDTDTKTMIHLHTIVSSS